MKIQQLFESTPTTQAPKVQVVLLELGWDDVDITTTPLNEFGTPTIVLTAVRSKDAIIKRSSTAVRGVGYFRRRIKVVGYIDEPDFYWKSHDI